jgi:uncharacterized protein
VSHWLPTWAIFLALAYLAPARAAEVPFLSGRVVDDAQILQPVTRSRLEVAIVAHERSTTDQIVVLTVPTIGDQSVEEYATRVFETWKLGIKGKDNGVLVVIVPQDRKMRIEVGYGLEGTLTDVASSRIIRNVMTPQFKAGDFDKGVLDGVQAIIAQLEGKAAVAPDLAGSNDANPSSNGPSATMDWPMRILIGTFVFGIIGLFTFIGIMTPGFGGWFLYVFLIPFWAAFPIAIIGSKVSLVLLAIYVICFPAAKLLLKHTAWYAKAAQDLKVKGRASIGGFTVMSGGSSGGGSSDGGGFSGGGGSSGGGGASGSW